MAAARRRLIIADDLYRFQTISGCQIAPDGEHIAYSVERVDAASNKKCANLWIAPAEGGTAYQFTFGDHIDMQPRWSPDGQRIAFISTRGERGQPQIYTISFGGGEARQLTDLQGTITPSRHLFSSFSWSPDGRRLVCQFRIPRQAAGTHIVNGRELEGDVVVRRFTRTFFKLDGTGYLPDERWHLWTVDAETGELHQLTDGDGFDDLSPAWAPDGAQIVFCSNRSQDPDSDPDADDIYVISADGGTPRRIPTPYGPKTLPGFSRDGRWISYVGRPGQQGEWWRNNGLWIVPSDGKGQAGNLTAEYDLHVANASLSDMADRVMVAPTWSADSRRVYFQVTRHGNCLLQSVSSAGGDLQTVVGRDGAVGEYSFDASSTRLAYFHSQLQDPGQVWVREMNDGADRRLTRVNHDLLDELDLGEVEVVWFKGAAGNDLQGWILKPPDFDPARTYPAVVEIHGGPELQYGNVFTFEFYHLAAKGYVVGFSNPRGGEGYGEEHARAIWQAWGTADYADVMTWSDLIAQQPYVDPERMGVTGGSYGGFMTNWIISHTRRFKAAVSERSVSNLISLWGSADLNWTFQFEAGNRPPWENFEQYWEISPMKHMGNARTPTLIIHSEQDHRCPIEQGEQVFVALKRLGVPAELIVFPEESHTLWLSGRTDRRVERLKHIACWFDRYLRDKEVAE